MSYFEFCRDLGRYRYRVQYGTGRHRALRDLSFFGSATGPASQDGTFLEGENLAYKDCSEGRGNFLRFRLCDGQGNADCHDSGGLWRRLSQVAFRQGGGYYRRKEMSYFRQSLYGPVHGGCQCRRRSSFPGGDASWGRGRGSNQSL